jgi:putative endonuclease
MAGLCRPSNGRLQLTLKPAKLGNVGGWVYIMTNRPNGTVYVGVTNDLARRVWEHREGAVEGFTTRYGLKRLVFAEHHDEIHTAIQREKTIKHWPRLWKLRMIAAQNPNWDDLYEKLV